MHRFGNLVNSRPLTPAPADRRCRKHPEAELSRKSFSCAALFLLLASPAFAASSGGIAFRTPDAAGAELGRKTWKDQLAIASPTYAGGPPEMVQAQVRDRFGRLVTATFLGSDVTCNTNQCGLRVTADDKLVMDIMVCMSPDELSLASDGTFVEGCGVRELVPAPGEVLYER
jgi:hypothetical protein